MLCSNILQISSKGYLQPRKQLSIVFSRSDLFLMILTNSGLLALPILSAEPHKFLSFSTMTFLFGGRRKSTVDVLQAWVY